MEPPLRIRALQLAVRHDSKSGSKTKKSNSNFGPIVIRQRDTPTSLDEGEEKNDKDARAVTPNHQRPPPKAVIEQQRRRFLRSLLTASVADLAINSTATSRESLFGGFVNDLAWIQNTPSRFLVLQQLRNYFDAGQDGGPMAAATEALLLAQFSLTLRDDGYLDHARKRYGLAMSRCAKRLATRPNRLADWIEALAAIQALWTCEMYEQLSEGAKVWIKHSDGMFAIIRQLPIEGEDLVNGDLRMIIYNTVDSAIKTAIYNRKAPVFAEQRWLGLLSSHCDGRGWCLQHIVCRLPIILYEMDRLSDRNMREAIDMLQELATIERDLMRWLQGWYESCDYEVLRTKSVEDFPDFVSRHRNTYSLFPRVFDFPSPVEAQGHLIYFDWLSLVRQTICDLHTRPQCASFVSEIEHKRALDKADEAADAACMLAPYTSLMDKTEPSKALAQVIELAMDWYERTKQVEKLKYLWDIRGTEEKHLADHQSLRWLDVNGFLARRVLLQHCVGPPRCVLKEHAPFDTS